MDESRLAPTRRAEDLVRAVLRADAVKGADGNTLVGYPAVFDEWTEINNWVEGNFLERLGRGAFKKTVKERGGQVKVLFNHGYDPSIGDKPLGKPAVMREDDAGLWTETPLADTSYNRDLLELLRVGALDGMSFRFSVVAEDWRDEPGVSDYNPKGLPERTIREVRLFEFGPVTFPAYEATSAGVRGREAYALWTATPAPRRAQVLQAAFGEIDAAQHGTSIEPAVAPLTTSTRRSTRFDMNLVTASMREYLAL